jgi:tRNA A-37 threonylcarbamoyl transferase component Bud32
MKLHRMEINARNIRFKINPAFAEIAEYILNIDSGFSAVKSIIENRRNDIRIDNVKEFCLVIKSFKGMYWPNRVAYSFVRKSKARRSFETSMRLESMGFRVSIPVAYVDYYKFGILQSSYFISLHVQHEDFQGSLYRYTSSHQIGKLFAGFAFQLHAAGVYHTDFSKGNVLCMREGDRIYFALVDLNRVRFQCANYRSGLKTLSKLGITQHHFEEILMIYTQLWSESFSDALQTIQAVQKSRSHAGKIRKRLKRIFFPSRVNRQNPGEIHPQRAQCGI